VSNGRSERRIARTVNLELRLGDAPESAKVALTENVSGHGARVLVERKLQPGQQVLVSSPKEGVQSQARIVYCQRVGESEFLVGLELSAGVEQWARPY
jgi:PilZ domain-containing protein